MHGKPKHDYLKNKQNLTWDLLGNDIWLDSWLSGGNSPVGFTGGGGDVVLTMTKHLLSMCWSGFGEPETTQSMHVDLTCVCMCIGGLGDAIARFPVWPATYTYGSVPDLEGGNSPVDSTWVNLVLTMAKHLLSMFLCPNQRQRRTLVPRLEKSRRIDDTLQTYL
jgi:hypothetical protein